MTTRLASFAATLLLLVAVALPARAVEVARVVSPGGIEAWLVEDHSNPIIALELAFRGGGALDPDGKEGLANLLAGTLDEGAGELDSQAFQARLQDLAIRLSFDSGVDSFQGSLQTLTENRDSAFELLRLALTAPRFDAEPLERIRSQILAGLRQRSEDPDYIAGRTLRQMLFPGHPYSRPSDGTPESLAGITADDLRRFVAERLARDNLKIAVVGDISAAELAALLDATFGSLPARAAPISVPEVTAAAEGGVVVIDKAVPQSVVALGQPGIKRHDPDFYAAYVVNYILGGGGFASRLYEEVREKRGLAYSVYAYLSPLDHSSLVAGGVATANARVAESLALIRQEWARMAEEGPSAEELEDAKTYLTGSYPLRLSSSGRVAGMLVGIQLDELGIDYINRRNDFIEAVTLEDARRVAARLYDADALSVVVVGQPEGIKPTRPAPAGAS
jgi:zinc protease